MPQLSLLNAHELNLLSQLSMLACQLLNALGGLTLLLSQLRDLKCQMRDLLYCLQLL